MMSSFSHAVPRVMNYVEGKATPPPPPPPFVINFGDVWPTPEPLSAVLETTNCLYNCSVEAVCLHNCPEPTVH